MAEVETPYRSRWGDSSPNHRDDETSSQHSLKRSHSAMDMDIDSPGATSDAEAKRRKDKKKGELLTPGQRPNGTPSSGRKTYSSVFSGSKIKHLKKPDGEPLWRKDIQYEFLHAIFHDERKVFTNSYDGSKGWTFSDVYVDAMARSSKTSKILRDKLLSDKPSALNMAMVCLLVNIGRMNTTLNFFPEMRAQLRTYHPIPSLQSYADPSAYKQLQDAPRLKSILKGASEDRREPITLDQILNVPVPRTNPINLCFVLSTYASKVTQLHFNQPRDFFDLVMRTTLSSQSRANAFLWLNWWYLESNFTKEDALNNPYGPGLFAESARPLLAGPPAEYRPQRSRRNSNSDLEEPRLEEKEVPEAPQDVNLTNRFKGMPIIVPAFEGLTEEQAALENMDTPDEERYGKEMKEERYRKMQDPEANLLPARNTQKRKKANEEYALSGAPSPAGSASGRFSAKNALKYAYDDDFMSDSDVTRMGSPEASVTRGKSRLPRSALGAKVSSYPDDDTPVPGARRARGSKNTPVQGVTKINFNIRSRNADGGFTLNPDGKEKKYTRPLTQHQIAIQENRKRRVDHEIDRMVILHHGKAKRRRYRSSILLRIHHRIQRLPDPFAKSDDEVDLHEPMDTSDMTDEARIRHEKLRKHKYNNGTNRPGPAGIVALSDEEDDFGEEVQAYADALRRAKRRLLRHEGPIHVSAPRKHAKHEDERDDVDMRQDDSDEEDDNWRFQSGRGEKKITLKIRGHRLDGDGRRSSAAGGRESISGRGGSVGGRALADEAKAERARQKRRERYQAAKLKKEQEKLAAQQQQSPQKSQPSVSSALGNAVTASTATERDEKDALDDEQRGDAMEDEKVNVDGDNDSSTSTDDDDETRGRDRDDEEDDEDEDEDDNLTDEEGWVVHDDEGHAMEGEDARDYKMEGIEGVGYHHGSISSRGGGGGGSGDGERGGGGPDGGMMMDDDEKVMGVAERYRRGDPREEEEEEDDDDDDGSDEEEGSDDDSFSSA